MGVLPADTELRPIEGFSGYFVSREGRVWSARQRGHWLTPSKGQHGYLTVGLRKGNNRYRRYVHRLVAAAWVDNPGNLPQVNHLDEDKSNNDASNLEWCTAQQNSNHGTRNQRISKPVVNVDTGERYPSITEASIRTGISYTAIHAVCTHRPHRITAGRHRWAYESEVF